MECFLFFKELFFMTMNIDNMSVQEIIDYIKKKDKRSASSINSTDIETIFAQHSIMIRCPACDSNEIIKNGKYNSGATQYQCKKCHKKFSVKTNTLFEFNDFTWDEMVKAVHCVITQQSIGYTAVNIRKNKINKSKAWLLYMKILYLLSKMPKPELNGVIQIDEKYFREDQKGNHELVSFLDTTKTRKARRHNYRSECGIFGPEFVNVLCAVDSSGHYYAKCVCLGPMTEIELLDLESRIKEVSYICTDNLELYRDWTMKHCWKHYVEPSTFRKERKARGYIDTDNIYQSLSEAEYKKDRQINERLYKEKLYPHIENNDKKISYDEFIALRYKFGLNINAVNRFHARLEEWIITKKKGVASKYLPIYVEAFAYLLNYKKDKGITSFSLKDAEAILLDICHTTLKQKSIPTKKDIDSLSVDYLPRPSKKVINKSRQKMLEARKVIAYREKGDGDKSAYEGTEDGQYIFNKRKFFNSLGATRINELIKQNGLYEKGQHKREKVNKLCALPNADDIIFYEIYLHRYGTPEELIKSIQAKPEKRGRGRPKKTI